MLELSYRFQSLGFFLLAVKVSESKAILQSIPKSQYVQCHFKDDYLLLFN